MSMPIQKLHNFSLLLSTINYIGMRNICNVFFYMDCLLRQGIIDGMILVDAPVFWIVPEGVYEVFGGDNRVS